MQVNAMGNLSSLADTYKPDTRNLRNGCGGGGGAPRRAFAGWSARDHPSIACTALALYCLPFGVVKPRASGDLAPVWMAARGVDTRTLQDLHGPSLDREHRHLHRSGRQTHPEHLGEMNGCWSAAVKKRRRDDLGWGGDHVGKLEAFRAAIRILAGGGRVRDRYDRATACLVTYWDVPERLRPALKRVREARRGCRRVITPPGVTPVHAVWAFDQLAPVARKQIVADITTLYEACLIDIGRGWPQWDFVFPKGELIPKSKRPNPRKKAKANSGN
jgi:hypothetical protein